MADIEEREAHGTRLELAQRLQAPSGLGYLLENRLIIGPQLHDPFDALRVQRVAATFRSLLDGLMRASPAGERSRIVLLTPGPLNETYFEQVFLARYLGVTLVEGSDLTVRGKRLYLKTLHGLERVHVLLRRVDSDYCDPLEFRPDSELGLPGLVEACRVGTVSVVNTLGSGVLENPVLAAAMPRLARAVLGEQLLLRSLVADLAQLNLEQGSQLRIERQDQTDGRGRLYYTLRMRYYQDAAEVHQALSAIAQHAGQGATTSLLTFAQSGMTPQMRGRALSALAQRAAEQALPAIDAALQKDPDTEMKKLAVNALTRFPNGEGIPKLMEVARSHPNADVRRQAMLRLGDTRDPRVVDFFAQILLK